MGGREADFSDRMVGGMGQGGGFAAIVLFFPAVVPPVFLFGATAINAISDSCQPCASLVRSGLVGGSGSECKQLRVVAAVELKLTDLLTSYSSREFGGLRFHLVQLFALDYHLGRFGADGEDS